MRISRPSSSSPSTSHSLRRSSSRANSNSNSNSRSSSSSSSTSSSVSSSSSASSSRFRSKESFFPHASILTLPRHIIVRIISLLSLKDLIEFAQTCRLLRRITFSNQVWRRIYRSNPGWVDSFFTHASPSQLRLFIGLRCPRHCTRAIDFLHTYTANTALPITDMAMIPPAHARTTSYFGRKALFILPGFAKPDEENRFMELEEFKEAREQCNRIEKSFQTLVVEPISYIRFMGQPGHSRFEKAINYFATLNAASMRVFNRKRNRSLSPDLKPRFNLPHQASPIAFMNACGAALATIWQNCGCVRVIQPPSLVFFKEPLRREFNRYLRVYLHSENHWPCHKFVSDAHSCDNFGNAWIQKTNSMIAGTTTAGTRLYKNLPPGTRAGGTKDVMDVDVSPLHSDDEDIYDGYFCAQYINKNGLKHLIEPAKAQVTELSSSTQSTRSAPTTTSTLSTSSSPSESDSPNEREKKTRHSKRHKSSSSSSRRPDTGIYDSDVVMTDQNESTSSSAATVQQRSRELSAPAQFLLNLQQFASSVNRAFSPSRLMSSRRSSRPQSPEKIDSASSPSSTTATALAAAPSSNDSAQEATTAGAKSPSAQSIEDHDDRINEEMDEFQSIDPKNTIYMNKPCCCSLDWMFLFKNRRILENNWLKKNVRLLTLQGHLDSVYCIQFDRDRLVSGSRDQTIKIWDARNTYTTSTTLLGHTGSVLSLQYDAADGTLITGSSDSTVMVWDLHRGVRIQTLRGHHSGVLDVALGPDFIVSCSKDSTIKIWDRVPARNHAKDVKRVSTNASAISAAALAHMATGSTGAMPKHSYTNTNINYTPKKTNVVRLPMESHVCAEHSMAPFDEKLSFTSDSLTTEEWYLEKGYLEDFPKCERLNDTLKPRDQVACVGAKCKNAGCPNTQRTSMATARSLVSGHAEDLLEYSKTGPNICKSFPTKPGELPPYVQMYASSAHTAGAHTTSAPVTRRVAETMNVMNSETSALPAACPMASLAYLPGQIYPNPAQYEYEHRCTLPAHRAAVNAIQLRGNTLVSASGDYLVKVWRIESKRCGGTAEHLLDLRGHARGIACVAFDGRYVISGSNDRTIRVWDLEANGACIRTLTGHAELVRTLALDPVGMPGILVSGSYDQSVKVWNWRTGKELMSFEQVHSSWVFNVALSSTQIISASQDQSIVVYDFAENVDCGLIA